MTVRHTMRLLIEGLRWAHDALNQGISKFYYSIMLIEAVIKLGCFG